MDDTDSLRHYATDGSEDAFAALVQRYLPLVYAAALRRVGGDTHRAKDVAQSVFIALARNARALTTHPDLTGWLFTTTRFLATKTVRTEHRRQTREQEASLAHDAMTADSPPETAAPLHAILDDVTMELRQLDRQVILLRFHRGLRLAEIGAQLGATETAVQKRLDRALDQLKEKLARRGITSTATALALAFEQQAAAVAMPASLAAAATTAGLAAGAGAGSLLAVSTLMTFSKLQLGVAATVIAATSAGLVWQARENSTLRTSLAQQAATLHARTAELEKKQTALNQRASAAEADAASLQTAVQKADLMKASLVPPTPALIDRNDPKEANAAIGRASQLARAGKFKEALEAYLKLYREFGASRSLQVRQQSVMTALKTLGEKYPPALSALTDLRDAAMQKLKSGPSNDENLMAEIGLLNDRLGDHAASIALYDSLSQGKPGRQALAFMAHGSLVDARRYADAMVGKSFGSMIREFDIMMSSHARMKGAAQTSNLERIIRQTLPNIEALIGAGQLDDARVLTEKILALDNSDATRAAIQQRVERAGQPPAPR